MNSTLKDKLFDLTDKVAIVPGGASGLGKGMALELANHGANIVIADVNEALGVQVNEEIKASGRQPFFFGVNVSTFHT